MVTTAKLEKTKIDAVEEIHSIREKLAKLNSEEIQNLAIKAHLEIEKLRQKQS